MKSVHPWPYPSLVETVMKGLKLRGHKKMKSQNTGFANLETLLWILFLSFRRVLNVIYSFLGNSPASEF